MSLSIRSADPYEPGVLSLIDALDAYQRELYPAESNHLEPPSELRKSNVVFLCAAEGGAVVGCGAAKVLDGPPRYGEIKRMFVLPAARGRGVSRQLLQALEARLLARDVHLVRLETGIHQPQALRLYERMGYRRRPPFGDYTDDPLSVFMEKRLCPAATPAASSV